MHCEHPFSLGHSSFHFSKAFFVTLHSLRGKAQVQALLRYVVEEPPENADNKRAFKFPFIACEIFTCEIDVIFKTLVEDEELVNYLFSFLEPDRPHGTLLAGYFSKVAIRLLLRKTVPVMRYLQTHQEVLKKLVDLIGITSIMQVLSRLVDDEHIYAYHVDSLQWLADTDLLEMLVDKLSPPHSSDVHANAAETLSAVTRVAPSALASKLSSPKYESSPFLLSN
jgi:serine/threonine-protein phosphatase 6 regulatory subunit 3